MAEFKPDNYQRYNAGEGYELMILYRPQINKTEISIRLKNKTIEPGINTVGVYVNKEMLMKIYQDLGRMISEI